MRAYDIIQKKRDGGIVSDDELQFLISGLGDGTVSDYQLTAFLMAVFFRGMQASEVTAMTKAMLHSGIVVDLSDVPGKKADKHSTGGVGDKISLPLAPAVAACGVPVPMISGRGLGHTGGTLDKLESIPGFRVDLDLDTYRKLVKTQGCCLIGQTKEVAPADKKLYALRDVTATVDCIPLIASSIMSKKLAEGIDALVLDVKVGTGAFMKTRSDAEKLARTMVSIGSGMGKTVVARLTAMDQPIGRFVGNSLEVMESLDVLEGKGPDDTVALTVELGAEMLVMGGVATDLDDGRARIKTSLHDGSARERFGRIIEAQYGDRRVVAAHRPQADGHHRHARWPPHKRQQRGGGQSVDGPRRRPRPRRRRRRPPRRPRDSRSPRRRCCRRSTLGHAAPRRRRRRRRHRPHPRRL